MTLPYGGAMVAIGAIAFDEVVNFYHQLLEQEPDPYRPEVYAEFNLKGVRLGIFKPKASQEVEFEGAASGLSLCLEIDDLDAAIAHLVAMGYPPTGEILRSSHGRELYICDPAGNRTILYESQQ